MKNRRSCANGASTTMPFNGIQHTWRPGYGNSISMEFFSATYELDRYSYVFFPILL